MRRLGKISIAWIYIAQISIAQITIAQIPIAQISIAQISIAQIAIAQNSIAPLVPTPPLMVNCYLELKTALSREKNVLNRYIFGFPLGKHSPLVPLSVK